MNTRSAVRASREPGRQLPRFVDPGAEAGEIQPQELIVQAGIADPRVGTPDESPGVLQALARLAEVGVTEAYTRAEE